MKQNTVKILLQCISIAGMLYGCKKESTSTDTNTSDPYLSNGFTLVGQTNSGEACFNMCDREYGNYYSLTGELNFTLVYDPNTGNCYCKKTE